MSSQCPLPLQSVESQEEAFWGCGDAWKGEQGSSVETGKEDGNPPLLGGEQTELGLRGQALTLALRILQCRVQEAWS